MLRHSWLGTSDIPFPWFLMLGCNSQAQDLRSHGGCRIIGPREQRKRPLDQEDRVLGKEETANGIMRARAHIFHQHSLSFKEKYFSHAGK